MRTRIGFKLQGYRHAEGGEGVTVRKGFEAANKVGKIKVPRPYEALCTPNVLTMEFLEGKPFVQGLQNLLAQLENVSPRWIVF